VGTLKLKHIIGCLITNSSDSNGVCGSVQIRFANICEFITLLVRENVTQNKQENEYYRNGRYFCQGKQVSRQPVPYKVVARRLGDVAQCYADTRLAHDLISWDAKRNIAQMCADAWHWQEKTSEVR